MAPVNVVTPATLTLSKFVCPSTSRSPVTSKLTPTARVDPLKVKLASSSSSPPVPTITTRLSVRSSTLKVFACPPALISSKPEVVVTPAISTLSRLVCPSTSKSLLASIAPVNVVTPATLTLSKLV